MDLPLIDAGKPSTIVRAFLDRSQQDNAEQRAPLAAIVEATSDFVSTATVEGTLLYINQAGRNMLGMPADADVAGMTIADAHPAWARHVVLEEGIPGAIGQGSWSGETALLHTDGREVPVSQVIIAHKDAAGRVQYLSTIARDISDRKEAEERRSELEGRLRAAVESKDEFLGLLSHELRGAVSLIASASRLLRTQGEQLDPKDRAALLGDIGKASERLERTIDDLLLLARLEVGGKVELEPVAIEHLVRTVVGEFGLHREIVTKLEDGLPLAAGKDVYVERVLLNLLNNADKYSPAGLPIEIAARSTGDSRTAVSVRDYGPGIDPNEAEAIFGRFYRSNRASGRAGGLGLGLRVCRRIVEAIGGEVFASHPEGGGLEVTFTLAHYEVSEPFS